MLWVRIRLLPGWVYSLKWRTQSYWHSIMWKTLQLDAILTCHSRDCRQPRWNSLRQLCLVLVPFDEEYGCKVMSDSWTGNSTRGCGLLRQQQQHPESLWLRFSDSIVRSRLLNLGVDFFKDVRKLVPIPFLCSNECGTRTLDDLISSLSLNLGEVIVHLRFSGPPQNQLLSSAAAIDSIASIVTRLFCRIIPSIQSRCDKLHCPPRGDRSDYLLLDRLERKCIPQKEDFFIRQAERTFLSIISLRTSPPRCILEIPGQTRLKVAILWVRFISLIWDLTWKKGLGKASLMTRKWQNGGFSGPIVLMTLDL